jgi:predicted nucleic acid-binding protein
VRRIVSDNGPLLHLTEARALQRMELIGDVQIPRQVAGEMAYLVADWRTPAWITVEPLLEPYLSEALAWQHAGLLDAGEAEAVALARQVGAAWFLTDDAAARLFATALGIEVHGSLGILLWAAAVGHLDRIEAEAVLSRLAASSLWVSGQVLDEARSALRRIFE